MLAEAINGAMSVAGADDIAQQIAMLETKVKIMQLQAQLAELQQAVVPDDALAVSTSSHPVVTTDIASAVAQDVGSLPVPPPLTPSAAPLAESLPVDSLPVDVSELAASFAAFDTSTVLPIAAGVALLPLGAKVFADFVEARYAQIKADEQTTSMPPTLTELTPQFDDVPSAGAMATPLLDDGVVALSLDGTRSAPDILFNDVLDRHGERTAEEGLTKEDAKGLMQKVKDAGVAGAISYAAWELGFWGLSVPVALSAFYGVAGHLPDLSKSDDMQKLGAEAFAFINVGS